MLHKFNWTNLMGEVISLTAAFVLIAVAVLSIDIGLSNAQVKEPDQTEKKPSIYVEEEIDIPDPCANGSQDGLYLMDFEQPEPGEKDCDTNENPAKEVVPNDPCGDYVFARNTDEPYIDNDGCAVSTRDI